MSERNRSPSPRNGSSDACPAIRVLIVDDHVSMRRGLAMLLGNQPGIEVVGEAPDGAAAIEAVRRATPDVVLMDIAMPEMDGIEATRVIRDEYPDISVIALSMYEEGRRGEEIREAGAVAFISKNAPPQDVIALIREIA